MRESNDGETGRRTGASRRRAAVPVSLSPYERARATAIATHLAATAAKLQLVRRLRTDLFGRADAVVDRPTAARLLRSPAVRFMTIRDFSDDGISLVDHEATIQEEITDRDDDGGRPDAVTLLIASPATAIARPVHRDHVLSEHRDKMLLPPVDADAPRREPVTLWDGSVLDRIQQVGKSLSSRYGWRFEDAVWFALTGEPIVAEPITAHIEQAKGQTGPVIAIRAEPWVPADTVVRVYREAQRSIVGGENRPIGLRLLSLFCWVIERRSRDPAPTWRALTEEWNTRHPEWAYRDERALASDYSRALPLLTPPHHEEAAPPSEERSEPEAIDRD